ncbi:TRAM domain-containing protein [Natronosalvus vescus]|uniref:TRAM domain-containing protein n=1 Tax=Natronosalvus vescus TaxID=2953881 RepID=UPI002091705A|nr:TRAM domain-containing protein [Natronosalvus vescus]
MEISDQLLCMFSGRIEERDGSYIIEIPEQELRLGDVDEGIPYRVAVLSTLDESIEKPQPEREPEQKESSLEPPVETGETRVVDIEGIGEQGDGIARVERGYVVIVSDTEKGERVRIEINQVQENVAFADVVEQLDYYE